ncbi:hypothetical protein CONCODRAFT_80284, partial [Conidiobolus coronatus NRRL 28638]
MSQDNKSLKTSTINNDIQNSFLEILKNHIKDNKYTGHISAMKQYRSETGLEVSTNTMRNSIEILVKELGQEYAIIDSYIFRGRELNRNIKLKDRHLKCLKGYLIEDKYIGPAQANRKLNEETGLEVSNKTVLRALNGLRVKMGTDYVNLDLIKLKNKQLEERSKLKDSHIECLKKHLKEDNNIGPAQANRKLYEETGLDISKYVLGQTLIKLRKQTGVVNNVMRTVKDIESDQRIKLKEAHLECLKKYLIEDKYIGPTQANRKLHEETGLKASNNAVRNCLKKLRDGLGVEYSNLDLNLLKSKRIDERSKIKDSHLKCLKKYLSMDASIGTFQAKRMLHEETGLEVHDGAVRKALVMLKKEMDLDLQLAIKNGFKVNKRKPRVKLDNLHLEYFEKYLIKDKYITGATAMKKFYEETDLEISKTTAYNTLKKLRDEMGPEYDISNTLMVINREHNESIKLKYLHLECLKKYLKEDKYISPAEANKKLLGETGLEINKWTMSTALKKLRKEMGPEYYNLELSVVRDRQSENLSKLKNFHLNCLKNYLNENPSIKAQEARDKLCQETGLEMSIEYIRQVLKKLV